MFLWVSLVLRTLEHAGSIQELRTAIDTPSKDLENLYYHIVEEIKERSSLKDLHKVLRILHWMSFARRPLKIYELQWGIALHDGNTKLTSETKPLGDVIDICKPLIEDGPNQTVIFIHSSVKE